MYILFYMARYVTILRRAIPGIHYKGHWKGWAQEIKTFSGPEMAASEASPILAQKSNITYPSPPPIHPYGPSLQNNLENNSAI
jgi:hypothetical protein